MGLRTDMALELTSGTEIRLDDCISVTRIDVDNALGKKINKPAGKYITIESRIVLDGISTLYSRLSAAIADELKEFAAGVENALVIGLGNPNLTADALGSRVFNHLIVTRHSPAFVKSSAVSVSAFCPNVMGVTGIESFDIIKGLAEKVKPDLIIAIDSLASAAVSRLACAFQICSSGITPGSGVSNHRKRLDKSSLGAEVISLGVPTVVYADTIISDALGKIRNKEDMLNKIDDSIAGLIVAPKEIDIFIEDCGRVIADAINMALGLSVPDESTPPFQKIKNK